MSTTSIPQILCPDCKGHDRRWPCARCGSTGRIEETFTRIRCEVFVSRGSNPVSIVDMERIMDAFAAWCEKNGYNSQGHAEFVAGAMQRERDERDDGQITEYDAEIGGYVTH